MSNIREIQVDNTTYDIAAKNLVNGFTQSTASVNALDAAAGKTLNDNKAPKNGPELTYKIGTNDDFAGYPRVVFRSAGNATNGRVLSMRYETSDSAAQSHYIFDKDGNFLPGVFNRYSGFNTIAFTVSASSTKTLTLENDARFMIVILGRYVSHQALIIGGTNAAGTVAVTTIQSASQIVIDTATTNKLKIQNTHGSNTANCICFMYGDTATVS